MLDVRRLTLLRELHHRGTIAAVAEALHQSPSSVSQQLSVLEREVGVRLLDKVGRRLQLTPQAEILVAHTEVVLERLERAETELEQSLATAAGTIRVGLFQSAALTLLPAVLRRLAVDHPMLRVQTHQREPEAALADTSIGDFDLVVAEQYPGHAAAWHARLDRQPLVADAIALAVPREGPFASVGAVSDAAAAAWTMEPDEVASRHWAEQACRQAGFEPDVRYETTDLRAQIDLVAAGFAVAFIPGLMAPAVPAGVRLVTLAGDPRRQVFTATRPSMVDNPAVRAVRSALASAAGLG